MKITVMVINNAQLYQIIIIKTCRFEWFGKILKIELWGRAGVRFSYSDTQNKRDELECHLIKI